MAGRSLLALLLIYLCASLVLSCGQIGMISGGAKDTLAPVLISVVPDYKSTGVNRQLFTFTFDEYIDVRDAFTEVLISPYQHKSPRVNFNRREVTVRLRDSLLPNTTYTIDFGKAIRDINESNILHNFTYVFSTGPQIDSLQISGRVLMAETGEADSTLQAYLYADTEDTVVVQRPPDYIARINGSGEFVFQNLPPGEYRVFALKDKDGTKTYNNLSEVIAFSNQTVTASFDDSSAVFLKAYQQVPDFVPPTKAPEAKKFTTTLQLDGGLQDITQPLTIAFSRTVSNPEALNWVLMDTLGAQILPPAEWDSVNMVARFPFQWKPGMAYELITDSTLADTLGNFMAADTIRFTTKMREHYGRVVLNFPDVDLSRNPVLQFFTAKTFAFSHPLTAASWKEELFAPGDYTLRILYDTNGNGIWDPGNIRTGMQPEEVISLAGSLQVRADWDNERTILTE